MFGKEDNTIFFKWLKGATGNRFRAYNTPADFLRVRRRRIT